MIAQRDRIGGQRTEADAHAKTRRGVRGFASRMPGADHDHIEVIFHIYLPMQNRVKMCDSSSSGARLPAISSSAARAS